MNGDDVERRVREIVWPDPPVDMRARVLSAATAVKRRVTWSDRVWFSRTWRIAAASIVVAAIAVDVLSHAASAGSSVATSQTAADVRVVDETGREIGLTPSLTAALAQRAQTADERRAAINRQQTMPRTIEDEGDRR